MAAVVLQIMLIDVVFSLDSVITAVGISGQLVVMIPAIVIAELLGVLEIERRRRLAEEALIAARAELWNARIDLHLDLPIEAPAHRGLGDPVELLQRRHDARLDDVLERQPVALVQLGREPHLGVHDPVGGEVPADVGHQCPTEPSATGPEHAFLMASKTSSSPIWRPRMSLSPSSLTS